MLPHAAAATNALTFRLMMREATLRFGAVLVEEIRGRRSRVSFFIIALTVSCRNPYGKGQRLTWIGNTLTLQQRARWRGAQQPPYLLRCPLFSQIATLVLSRILCSNACDPFTRTTTDSMTGTLCCP